MLRGARLELKVIVIGFACATAAMFALVTILKWREVWAARHWIPVKGKITSSRVEAREVAVSGSGSDTTTASEIRNFPAITFEYTVDGRKLRGTRYSLRHEVGNVHIPETLARYPRGAEVAVFYDPSDPGKAVIERTMPAGSIKILAYVSAGLVIGSIALVFLVEGALEAVRPHLPRPQHAEAGMFLAIMGSFILRMAFAQKAMAAVAAKWPTVKGRIVDSGMEVRRTGNSFDGDRARPSRSVFKSRVRYSYRVAGDDYVSDRIAFGMTVAATLPGLVDGDSRRYPGGGVVQVRFDPANPAAAVLECRVRGLWVLWGVAGAMLAGAAVLVGLI